MGGGRVSERARAGNGLHEDIEREGARSVMYALFGCRSWLRNATSRANAGSWMAVALEPDSGAGGRAAGVSGDWLLRTLTWKG